jgi:hypothetical protein
MASTFGVVAGCLGIAATAVAVGRRVPVTPVVDGVARIAASST